MEIKIEGQTPPTPTELNTLIENAKFSQPTLESSEPSKIATIATKQALELEGESSKYDNDVDIIRDWAKAKVGDDPQDIKWAIRDLIMRLGTPTFGDHIKHVARFAYLDTQEKKIKAEKESFR